MFLDSRCLLLSPHELLLNRVVITSPVDQFIVVVFVSQAAAEAGREGVV